MASTQIGWTSACFVLAFAASGVCSYAAVPRWGQASTLLYDKLLISGGKTDPQHQFTYTSAPNSNDLLSLDLSAPFALTSPPWSYISGSQNISTSQGPAVAFHTLTPYTSSELLLFGGDAGFSSIQTHADSAWLLNVKDLMSPLWSSQVSGWASEPIRRVYHTAPSASGAVYILGGEKADGSQIGTPDAYLFNVVANSGSSDFIPLTSTTNAPAGLVGHAAHILPGGTLLVFGGFFSSGSTPNIPSPLSTIYTLDTTSASPTWSIQNATGDTVPVPRRGFASALLTDGKILIHGGADATLETLYSDGAILDTTQTPMGWSPVDRLSETLGPRVGHFSAPINGQVLFGFGWGGNAAASANLALYDPASSSFQPIYTPPPSSVSITTLPVSPTSPGGTYPSSGTNTGQGGYGGSGSPTHPGIGSSPSSGSGSGQGGGGEKGGRSNDQKSSMVGVIVGSILGFLAFVAFVGGGMYYVLRQRERRAWRLDNKNPQNAEGRWRLMPEEDLWDSSVDESPTQPGHMVQMAGTRWHDQPRRGWGLLGLGSLIGVGGTYGTTGRRRLDMLADEDARRFDTNSELPEREADTWRYQNATRRQGTRRQGTGGSSMSIESRGTNTGGFAWNNVWNASITSLRNVGAALGVTATGLAAARESTGQSANTKEWLEKTVLPLDPFQDPAVKGESALMEEINPLVGKEDKAYLRPGESNASSQPSPKPHVDPFADPYESEPHIGDAKIEDTARLLDDIRTTGTALGGRPSSQRSLPRSFDMIGIAHSGDRSPGHSERGGGTSVESHEAPSSRSTQSTSLTGTGFASSSTDYSSTGSPTSPRTTSIIGATARPNVPMRRSDSWWSRFSRTSFRDRHSSGDGSNRTAATGGLADFRDPNPAPRLGQLGPIQESTHPSRQPTEDSNHLEISPEGPSDVDPRNSVSADATSTKSSIQTVNSVLIEGMDGRIEVVQRALSLTSRGTSSPAATFDGHDDSHKWGKSSMEASSSCRTDRRPSWLTDSDAETEAFVADSPTETTYPVNGSPTDTRSGRSSYAPSPSDASSSSTVVGEKQQHRPRRTLTGAVAARVSAYEQRLSQDSLTHSPPLNTKPSLKSERSRRGPVVYGLVPKASLYIANPDRRNPSGSS